MKERRILWGFFSLLLCLNQCAPPSSSHSALFLQVFGEEENEAVFRQLNLGDSITAVYQAESRPPVLEDLWGLAYQYEISEKEQLHIEYYIDNLQTGKESNRISSMIVNVFLEDEIQTAAFYEEVDEFFRKKYGPSAGKYGDVSWENQIENLEVHLRLYEEGNGITVNFVEL